MPNKLLEKDVTELAENFSLGSVDSEGYIEVNVLDYCIKTKFEPNWVRVVTDKELFSLLETHKATGAGVLATTLKMIYLDKLHYELNITVNSLALEIIGHAYFDKFATAVKDIPGLKLLAHKIHSHTDIIDCGDLRTEDGNRFFWDMTQGFYSHITEHIFN